MDENTNVCKWCGGSAKKLWQHDGYAWWDDFSFDQGNKVKIFICPECGRVMVESYYEDEEED